jgi:hypothetical protein
MLEVIKNLNKRSKLTHRQVIHIMLLYNDMKKNEYLEEINALKAEIENLKLNIDNEYAVITTNIL